MSWRDGAIVAWHEVLGDRATRRRPVRVRSDSVRYALRFGAHFDEKYLCLAAYNHTVPYWTVLSRDAFPGTSCQVTIGVVPTGRSPFGFGPKSPDVTFCKSPTVDADVVVLHPKVYSDIDDIT